MSYIDLTYFNGDLNIPSNSAVDTQLQWFINKYEPEFLRKVLGNETYLAFAYENPPTNDIWKALLNGADYIDLASRPYRWRGLIDTTVAGQPQSPIANYVYFYFMRNSYSQTTSMGEKVGKAENARDTGPGEKMIKAWNEMSDWVMGMQHFLRTKGPDVYPAWYRDQYWWYGGHNPFGKINWAGI